MRAKEQAFRQKYDQYGDMLYKLGMVYLGNPSDAEDALQEVFYKLLYRAPEFAGPEHERRWLIRVCINECKNRLAYTKRRQHQPLDESLTEDAPEAHEDVRAAILRLSPQYKDVIHLYYYMGYDIAAIAEILQLGVSAVKMRLVRARQMLRMELEEDHESK